MSWLLRVVTGAGWCLGRDAPVVPRENLRKIRKSNSGSPVIPFPLSCVTHSLSFPFTLLFRSRPFSPSYVPALFHFPTLCELLRTRHVFNELQVARSDSFRESISWAFLTSPRRRLTHVEFNSISFFLFFPLFPFFFYSFPSSVLRVQSRRYAPLIWRDQRSFLSSRRSTSSRSSCLCDLVPSALSSFPVSCPRKYDAHHFES